MKPIMINFLIFKIRCCLEAKFYFTVSMKEASQVVLVVKNLPANAGGMRRRFDPWVRAIPWRRALATHSSILAWRIQWTEEQASVHGVTKSQTWWKQSCRIKCCVRGGWVSASTLSDLLPRMLWWESSPLSSVLRCYWNVCTCVTRK